MDNTGARLSGLEAHVAVLAETCGAILTILGSLNAHVAVAIGSEEFDDQFAARTGDIQRNIAAIYGQLAEVRDELPPLPDMTPPDD